MPMLDERRRKSESFTLVSMATRHADREDPELSKKGLTWNWFLGSWLLLYGVGLAHAKNDQSERDGAGDAR